MEYYSVIENNEILPFAATWMDLENTIVIEVSQTKTNFTYHLYVKSKIIQMNLCTKHKQTHRHRKYTCGYQRRKGLEG